MTNANLQALFQEVLDRVVQDDFRLPSMPDVAMEVRETISKDNATCNSLTQIIAKDPAMTAFLIQAASSSLYRRPVPPKTLAEVVGILGFSATNSLVMVHSARNMVQIKNADAKKLFQHTWDRLVVKTSIASFLAQQFRSQSVDQVQMAMLLTEIGSLSVLSAMLEASDSPDTDIYFQMCREYSKRIGCAVLAKWKVDETIIDVTKDCGQWAKTWGDTLSLLDIANLALYYTVLLTIENPSLPDLESLAAFQKIPEEMRTCSKPNWLNLIVDNDEEIQTIIRALK